MLDKRSADKIASMLRQGKPALEVTRWALRQFPDLAPLSEMIAADALERAREDLGAWLVATIAGQPIPPDVRALCLAVSIAVRPSDRTRHFPIVRLEAHPDVDEETRWDLVDHWKESPFWEPPFVVTTSDAVSALEELTLVVTAALLGELAAANSKFLSATRALRLVVRPQCSDATITVGVVGPAGFDATVAAQDLFGVD